MIEPTWEPGPYTLSHLGQTLSAHVPAVLRGAPQLVGGFVGSGRLQPDTRVAVQLRLAKLLGCPVCRALFPRVAPRAGLSEAAVSAALDGHTSELATEASAALAWVEAVVRAGDAPAEVPPQAAALSVAQRDHLLVLTRLDMVIHSVGLMFLPHQMVERAHAS